MKKKIISCLAIIALFFNNAEAQTNTFPSSGNVGVGTMSPATNLHVAGNVMTTTISTEDLLYLQRPAVGGVRNTVTGGIAVGSYEAGINGAARMDIKLSGAPAAGNTYGTIPDVTVMTLNADGNVGIGTTLPENAEGWDKTLELKGTNHAKSIVTGGDITTGIYSNVFSAWGTVAIGGMAGTSSNHPFSLITNKAPRMTITAGGNIGIGNTSPSAKLQVTGSFAVGETPTSYIGNTHTMEVISTGTNRNLTLIGGLGTVECWSNWDNWTPTRAVSFGGAHPESIQDGNFHMSFFNGLVWNNDRFFIEGATGNTGIGTATPTEKLDVAGNIYTNGKILINQANNSSVTPYALAVNGSAIFTKAVVKLNASWPDYVFAKDYQLPTLASIEKYINENNHLPGVASAQEVADKGIDLGDNQAVLLKKVEELTLYLIELNKKVEALTKENEVIKAKLKN